MDVGAADLPNFADASQEFCAVSFTDVSSFSVDAGTINMTGVTELDSTTGADAAESLEGGLKGVQPLGSAPLEREVSADLLEQFSSVPDVPDPIEQFSFDAEVMADGVFAVPGRLLKGRSCVDGNECNSLFSDSLTPQLREPGDLRGFFGR